MDIRRATNSLNSARITTSKDGYKTLCSAIIEQAARDLEPMSPQVYYSDARVFFFGSWFAWLASQSGTEPGAIVMGLRRRALL